MTTKFLDEAQITDLPEFQQLASVHPAFQGRMTPLGRKELREVAKVEVGSRNPEAQIEKHIRKIAGGFNARTMQIIGNDFWSDRKPASEKEWRSAEPTFFNAIQDCITKNTDRINITRENVRTPEGRERAKQGIIINRDRINNTLLNNLELDNFIPPKGTKKEEAIIMREKATEAIREMIGQLEPFSYPHQDENLNPPSSFRVMLLKGGAVFGTENIDGQKTLFRSDIYSAERRLLHIKEGYDIEIQLLSKVLGELEEAFGVLERWHDSKGTEQIGIIEKRLVEYIEKFEGVHDEHKTKLLQQVTTALQVRYEKSNQMNPGAVRANLSTAIESIGKRLAKIEGTSGCLAKDEVKIQHIISTEERAVTTFLTYIESSAGQLPILKNTAPLTENDERELRENLHVLLKNLEKIQCEPNIAFAQLIMKHTEQLLKTLESERFDEDTSSQDVRREFIKIYLQSKLYRTHIQLQHVLKIVSCNGDKTDMIKLLGSLKAIYQQLRSSRLDDTTKTPEFTDPYIEVYKHLRSLIQECETYVFSQQGENVKLVAEKAEKQFLAIIRRLPLLNGMYQALKGKVIEAAQPYLPFPNKKSDTTEKMKGSIKEFDWDGILEAINQPK